MPRSKTLRTSCSTTQSKEMRASVAQMRVGMSAVSQTSAYLPQIRPGKGNAQHGRKDGTRGAAGLVRAAAWSEGVAHFSVLYSKT
eukprot:scaffold27403_cov62-Phaeocystis_antarctica.AAC.2